MSRRKRRPEFRADIIQRGVLSLFVLMMLVSCSSYDQVKAERARKVNDTPTINIAVIWDREGEVQNFLLVEGITQALDKINEKGGVFGRKIKIKVFYSNNDSDEKKLAQKVATDTSFAAVIGHRSSTNAIPASVSYEYYGLLFVAPSASNPNLTNHGFEYTFRTIQSDSYVSQEIAAFMKSQGQKQIAIVDDRSLFGKGIADGVMESLADLGLITVVRRHYSPGKTDFKPLCADLSRFKFDALFVGGMLPEAAGFIRVARQMGIKQRVYGGKSLDSRALEKIAGSASNGTIVPTSFNVELDNPLTQEFVKTFRKRYGKPPDTIAALGYDSMNILAEAMKRSKSADPSVVASNMRFIKNWKGVTGSFTYNLRGNLEGKKSYFKHLNQTRFIYFDAPQKTGDEKKE
ncbi:MAG: ABC transporter substrate-binding protein [Pseudomonadota bacterium]